MVLVEDPTVTEAQALLSIVPFVWAILTVSLMTPAWRWAREDEQYDLRKSVIAVVLSVASVLLSGTTVLILTPVALESFRNEGPVNGFLVAYNLVFVVVVISVLVAVGLLMRAVSHLREVRDTNG